jgi:hypothetical protein
VVSMEVQYEGWKVHYVVCRTMDLQTCGTKRHGER